ncbi:hypothetical protein LguiA_025581 [Lonicera macranthoides]
MLFTKKLLGVGGAAKRKGKGKKTKLKKQLQKKLRRLSIHIGNLPENTQTSDVEAFFPMATRVELSFEEGSNICKGYGCVEFKTKEEADKALEKNGQILNGNVVTLKIGEENAELPFQQGDVIVVQNFKVNDTLRQIRERLRARFVQCGQIKELFLPENLNLQNDKGTAYIEFAEYDGFKKAFHRQYADPLPGDSKRLSIITPKFEEMPFLSRMGGGRGGKWGYKDDNGYIEDDLPEDPTRSLLPIATGIKTFFS